MISRPPLPSDPRALLIRMSVVVLLLVLSSCSESPSGTGKDNQPPETSISLDPDGDLRTTSSRQHIHWWGDDPDGFVRGFFFSFDGQHWTFTTKNDSLFSLSLAGRDTSYVFQVRAVDNAGNRVYDEAGPYGPEPFTDQNGNGRYDSGEPFIDLGVWDPTPATLRYPIENTAPVVEFVKGSAVPDTTFPVATFSWSGTDLDGDETIREYQYALNDTVNVSSWRSLPRTTTFLTLHQKDGIREGNNVFYLRAVDVAGAVSRTVRMPDSAGTWFVRYPTSELLIVDDYDLNDGTSTFYGAILDTLLQGRYAHADVLDIRAGATSTKKGRFVPPYINPTLTETLKLFKVVLWYSDNLPSIDIAQLCLPSYQQSGGKILFTASFPESAIDPRGGITDFAPVDSIAPQAITFVPAGTNVLPDPAFSNWPTLQRDSRGVPVAFIRSLFRKIDARTLYTFEESSRWTGRPAVAVESGDRRFVIFSIPLHRFDGALTVGPMLWTLFSTEFGVR